MIMEFVIPTMHRYLCILQRKCSYLQDPHISLFAIEA